MKKILYLPIAILFACCLAGLYGVVHNQISYTVSPEYFHDFKFEQFAIAEYFQNRIGASLVGFFASWWMGLVIGLLIYIATMFIPETVSFFKRFMKVAALVVCITLCVGLGALLYSYIAISEANLPQSTLDRDLSNPVAFARAGVMHNFSYLGGLIGLIMGLIVVLRSVIKHRRMR